MTEIHTDILRFAVSRYLITKDLTPYDAIVENSAPHNDAGDWTEILMPLMGGTANPFKHDEILTADATKNMFLFKRQLDVLHDRTIKVATAGGMLCQKWLNDSVIPYSDNRYLNEGRDFIDNAIVTLS